MSRIKYPGEQEMKRQIQVILDESGMFEDDEKSQGYTECVQVKKRPFLLWYACWMVWKKAAAWA